MSMYGEPDLADLLPAYYCNYVARGRQQGGPSIWRGIFTHLFAMAIAIALCGSGFYYYQFVYIPTHEEKFVTKQDPTIFQIKEKIEKINYETVKPTETSKSQNKADICKKEVSYLKEELATIHSWRATINKLITKMEWEQDLKIISVVENAVEEYEADGIGIMDYAASYAGGAIFQISKETRPHPTHRPLSLFRIVNVDVFSSPEEIIRPCVLPGSCFAFRGRQGSIQIRLGKPINVGGITLSHGSRLLLGSEGMSSAPKNFEVHGFTSDVDDSGTFLGKFTYDWMGKQHQTFQIKNDPSKNQIFELVELTILSNYGKEEFTCVYRFRVHKRDVDTSDKTSQTSNGPSSQKKKKCC